VYQPFFCARFSYGGGDSAVAADIKIYLPDVIGKGYKTFWNFKGRYR
jgi:hypothetical protein